jgi:autotransporter-associated beta strand protein
MRLAAFKFVIALCGVFVTTGFGATITWSGGDGTGTAIGAGTNWVGGVSPNSGAGDVCQWDGTVPGNLFLTAASPNGNFNNGTPGVSFYVAAGHTGSWNLRSLSGASANIALNAMTIDSGAGAYSLGDGTANVLNVILRPSSPGGPPNSPIHVWANNSTNAATIFPNVRWQSGGGNPHIVQIDGTGDWIVNSTLCMANGPATFFVKSNTGTWFWSANSIAGAAPSGGIASPIDLEGGRLVMTATSSLLTTQRITNNATLQYNAPAAQTLSGPFNGTNGTLIVSAGTLTLSSSQSDWSGNIVLTNGGVLVAGGTQNVGGTGPFGLNSAIFFKGGTLQFSVANTFDYSPNFSPAANQAYSFNTGGQNVTFTNALTSSGGTLTKLGSGTLALTGANTYSGTTAVGAGKLILQSTAGTGAIIVSNSTALGVNQGGTQIAPSSLTVGTSSSATLEFNNVTSTATPAIAVAGAVSTGGPITVNVNSGAFTIGQSYPLFSWGSGSAPAVTLGTLVGAVGNLTTNGSTINLNITGLAYVWTGITDVNWDITTANDWKVNGVSQIWANGSAALFDDTATGQTNVTVNAPIAAASVTVNSSAKTYSITSSGVNLIGGSGSLTKNGNSTLTLSGGINTYSGATTLSGGTLSVSALANGGAASDIGAAGNSAANLVLNGGALQYTGGAVDVDRLFTLGTGNGALDASGSGALNLTNAGAVALSGTGARTLTLKGSDANDNTLAAFIGDNGGATSLAKNGGGKWVLTGNNTNSGTVTIAAGTLQVGNGGASGAVGSGSIVDNGTLTFNTTSTLTNGTITGTGAVTVDGSGTVILPGNNNYSGATTVNAGALQIGNGGATGTLNGGGAVTVNGTLIYNSTATINVGGLFGGGIGGTGNLMVRKGTFQALGANSYSGWTQIDPGASFQPSFGNQGQLASSVVTNNGALILGRQDNAVFTYLGDIVGSGSVSKIANNGNNGDVTLLGNNTYTGGTYILGGQIIFGNNVTPGAGAFVGGVFLTNDYAHNQFGGAPNDFVPATLVFNRPDDFIFPGNIVGEGFVTLTGAGMVTLTGNNTYTNRGTGNTTTISAGTLQVGNGGTSGSIGGGAVTDNALLVWNRSDDVSFGRVISGAGSFVKTGAGVLTLTAVNTYNGPTTVSNGTLVVTGGAIAGDLNLEGGTFVPASLTTGGGVNVAANLTIDAGTILAPLNKSLSVTNIVVAGVITRNGGSVVVTNVGPALAVNDKFYLFSAPVSGFATVTGAGATWQNDLATDGSITALTVPVTVNTNPPVVRVSVSGSTLSLAWPTNLGWTLQTNSVGLSSPSSWFPVSGSASLTNLNITINPAKTNVFFRMVYP